MEKVKNIDWYREKTIELINEVETMKAIEFIYGYVSGIKSEETQEKAGK